MPPEILSRHRTVLRRNQDLRAVQMRSHILRQVKQIHRRFTDISQGGFVKYDGTDAGRCAIKASDVFCAVVH